MVAPRSRGSRAAVTLCQFAGGSYHLLGVVVILVLAGESRGQHLAVRGDDDRADRERGLRPGAFPGQLDRPAQEPVIGAAGAEEVAQQHHVVELAGLGERHRSAGTVGLWMREVQPGGAGIGDEEGGYGEVQLVGQIRRQELGKHAGAAFDQESSHSPFGQIFYKEI